VVLDADQNPPEQPTPAVKECDARNCAAKDARDVLLHLRRSRQKRTEEGIPEARTRHGAVALRSYLAFPSRRAECRAKRWRGRHRAASFDVMAAYRRIAGRITGTAA
jgi:hypothetical protein